MKRIAYLAGAGLGFLGVALGAFGAHALKDTLLANGYTEVFDTATKYHLIHAGLLLIMGLMMEKADGKWLKTGIFACIAGIFLFSGSLYLLSTFNLKFLGIVTPFGGLAFLIAWASIFLHFYKKRN